MAAAVGTCSVAGFGGVGGVRPYIELQEHSSSFCQRRQQTTSDSSSQHRPSLTFILLACPKQSNWYILVINYKSPLSSRGNWSLASVHDSVPARRRPSHSSHSARLNDSNQGPRCSECLMAFLRSRSGSHPLVSFLEWRACNARRRVSSLNARLRPRYIHKPAGYNGTPAFRAEDPIYAPSLHRRLLSGWRDSSEIDGSDSFVSEPSVAADVIEIHPLSVIEGRSRED